MKMSLCSIAMFIFAVGWAHAEDPRVDPKAAARKAKIEARMKARAEAEAKAKAESAAKEKEEADARARAESKAKAEADAARKAAANRPKADHTPLTKRIDEEINKKLASEKVPASGKADDAEFLRRVYLDLAGVIPPASKVIEFLDSKDPQKRTKLIDELLASPAFGRHMADVWDNLLFQRITDNRAIQRDPLTKWLEAKFNDNTPWNIFVTELLTATGTQEDNGAATYFLAALSADKMVDSASRLFMGIKMECAQCHNHPFTGWKQNDYWGMAAFFTKVRVQGNPRNAKNGPTPGIIETSQGRQRGLPESAKTLPPKFFQGEQPKVGNNDPVRPVFAKWLTSADNKYFVRAFTNRVWGQLFGSGIVNPIDDMHEERVASHPELLTELSKQFASNGFDVKFLFRAICNSDAYQRSSKPAAGNESDRVLFSHMNVKTFTPEQLYDSLAAVLGEFGNANRPMAKGAQAVKRGPVTPRDQFVNFFDPGEGVKATDYEGGIPQALRLMNHPYTARTSGVKARELTKGLSKEAAIEKLYLTTVSRRPTSEEVERLNKYMTKASSAEEACGDILWALLNSSEFTLNH